MSRIARMLIASFVVVAMLMLGHSMMSPLPISAATTALGGLAALWLFRTRPTGALAGGAITGAIAGAGIHAYSHVVAGHAHPHVHDAIAAHIVGDVTIGVLMGLAVLCVPFVISRITARAAAN